MLPRPREWAVGLAGSPLSAVNEFPDEHLKDRAGLCSALLLFEYFLVGFPTGGPSVQDNSKCCFPSVGDIVVPCVC